MSPAGFETKSGFDLSGGQQNRQQFRISIPNAMLAKPHASCSLPQAF
jgi:hypothetical protein